MNIHAPQSLEAEAELRELSSTKNHIISAAASKPNIAIVQDALLGAYKMTYGFDPIRKDQFYQVLMHIDRFDFSSLNKRIQHIRKVLKQKGKKAQCFNGKGIVSMIFPLDFCYERKNNAHPTEDTLKIYKGVVYEGTLDKTVLGSSANAISQVLFKEYGIDTAMNFINNIQFIANQWILIRGFSVGLGDCLIQGAEKEDEISKAVEKYMMEAEVIKTTTKNERIREVRVKAALNKAKDVGMKIAKDALEPTNNFVSTIKSGSKGDTYNVCCVTGLLSQQNIMGGRVEKCLNHNKRTLPHYPFSEMPMALEYESRGFVRSSFIKGLNPREFFFHAISGREGVCSTAMGTAQSGYMQRRIVKLTEDIKTMYDGTIRDTTGRIYQFAFGENGIDPIMTVNIKGNQEICDVSRLVDNLNMNFEDELKQNAKYNM